MKKMATLIAGILMVCGVYGADETTKATTWDFSGTNVEYVHTFVDTDKDSSYAGKDVDLILKVKKTIDEIRG